MDYDITQAACLKDYCIYLKFRDGLEGAIDLASIAGKGEMFALLKDIDYFCQMKVDERIGTIVWPNEADLSQEVLYEKVKKAKPRVAVY
jgi:hypothetical protein